MACLPFGPIPAQAGEPAKSRCRWSWSGAQAGEPDASSPATWRAYPRAGGGTGVLPERAYPRAGGGTSPVLASRGAYPRAGGGTRRELLLSRRGNRPGSETRGLSPRRRGNRSTQAGDRGPGLSPRRRGNRSGFPRAYPRAGGGTLYRGPIPAQAGEPSVSSSTRAPRRLGPIPAQAGEPSSRLQGLSPRRRGNRQTAGPGLSPRRRGNQRRHAHPRRRGGPIPAQAGEPASWSIPPTAERAYPRAGGGTRLKLLLEGRRWGLSPRRRGNPGVAVRVLRAIGPIPAQAGEPRRCRGASGAAGPIPAQAGEPL